MATENLNFGFSLDSDLIMSVSDLKSKYFLGIPIVTPDGNPMPDEDIAFYIKAAQKELETRLDIKLKQQVIRETKDFLQEHYNNWSYIKATYPVLCINKIEGFIGKTRQVNFPEEWFQIRKTNDDIVHRTINLIPSNNGNSVDHSIVYSGIYPQMGIHGARNIPNYFTIEYTTGFEEIPEELLRVVGMMAAIPIYDLLGDIVIGAGIASQSLGLDGLSQSINTTSSAENHAYSARVKSYQTQIKELLPELDKRYKGFNFMTM